MQSRMNIIENCFPAPRIASGHSNFENGAVTGAFVVLVGEGLKKLGEMHYARNQKNNQYWKEEGFSGRDDISLDEFGDLETGSGGYIEVKAANAHQIGAGNEQNIKITTTPKGPRWLSKYGRYEIILRKGAGGYCVVTDSVNMGTLNYGQNNITHTVLDIVPGLAYGNVPNPAVHTSVGLRLFELVGANKGHKLGRALGF